MNKGKLNNVWKNRDRQASLRASEGGEAVSNSWMVVGAW